jgi:hypothetical protein
MNRIIPALLLAFFASAAPAARIVPAEPSAFDAVNLRMTVDSCTFVPGTVHVRAVANVLKLTQQLNACLVAGTPEVVDVRLGTLAPGDYRVEIFASQSTSGTPMETLAFQVRERAEAAVFPPPPRPLTDYSGLWWNPQESGWGLSLHQGASHAIFGAWFVYGASGAPEWFTLQDGHWTSSTTWTGNVYRTTGPFFGVEPFDSQAVRVFPAGSATLDFRQLPGAEDRARFTYTVNGVGVTRTVGRMAF